MSYLPSSVYDLPPTTPCSDDPERAEESLLKVVPRSRRQVYKMRPVIDAVVDKGSFFEVSSNFGKPIIVGLARLEGRAVLLLASDPMHYGGSWTAEACQKVVRWVDFAETFHLPVVYLMDCPGFMIGLDAEKAATITGIPEREIFDTILQRERLGSTGVGNGIAILHGKLAAVKRITGVFARLETPVDFEALDDQPVDLVFLLLAPEGAGADHLKALSRIARVLRDGDIVNKIRGSTDSAAIHALLSDTPASHAA